MTAPAASWRGPVRSKGAARVLTIATLAVGAALLARLVLRAIVPLEPAAMLWAAAGAVLGLAAIDGLTGLIHWACDTWGDEDTPVFGRLLIQGFREHHRLPQRMLQHDWVVLNRQPALGATALLALAALPGPMRLLEAHPALTGFVAAFLSAGALANQLHQWAHRPSPPRVVRPLQATGLALSPQRHAGHHRTPRTEGYCIATGWLNRPLDALGFWRRLEWLVTALTGTRPRAKRGAVETRRDWEAGEA